jgi:small subunit ribosomal protein S21
MIIIKVSEEKSIESALKTYKNRVQKSKQLQTLKERETYVKPSVQRREKLQKAKYTEKIKNGLSALQAFSIPKEWLNLPQQNRFAIDFHRVFNRDQLAQSLS